ncbi:VOC family protein [Alkalinema sp. FACHB-956]|uniref:VOC family protein n=1 Tax=Alkalinema sp. FACHB-956 TaxID=2692768 RepID=UPI001689AF54|nr:VOC family protein [Alkalinema sp. FACHB-956]MBD2325988.1 VOC family protein [Alkalinema sp. FACHB-956]
MAQNWSLNAVRVFVSDIENAKIFYCDMLGWVPKEDGRANGFLLFDVGAVQLVVETVDVEAQQAWKLAGRFTGVSFEVEDVRALYESLVRKGVEFVSKPEAKDWGGVVASFVDPDRNGITIFSAAK